MYQFLLQQQMAPLFQWLVTTNMNSSLMSHSSYWQAAALGSPRNCTHAGSASLVSTSGLKLKKHSSSRVICSNGKGLEYKAGRDIPGNLI